MIKKYIFYVIGIALAGWLGFTSILGIIVGDYFFVGTRIPFILLGLFLIWKAHKITKQPAKLGVEDKTT